jgi:uncharacterized membrane protein
MNEATSLALRVCLFAGIIILALGLLLSDSDHGTDILWVGILIMVASPFVGVLTTYAYLISEKDWKWVKVASVLIAVVAVSLAVSFLK